MANWNVKRPSYNSKRLAGHISADKLHGGGITANQYWQRRIAKQFVWLILGSSLVSDSAITHTLLPISLKVKPKTLHLSNGWEGFQMKCPMCGGDFDNVSLKTVGGSGTWAKHCNQCGGFWFEREPTEFLSIDSINRVDVPTPIYSLKQLDLVCSNDNSLLESVERDDLPAGTQYWKCPDCEGAFYPKGQLALMTHHNHDIHGEHIAGLVSARSRSTLAILLVVIGAFMMNFVANKTTTVLIATSDQVL